MSRQTQKKKHINYITTVAILAFLVFAIVSLSIVNSKMLSRRKALEKQANVLQEKLKELSDDQYNFEARVAQGDSGIYLEAVARNDFNLKKQGESVVAFPIVSHEISSKKPAFQTEGDAFNALLRQIQLKNQ